MSVTGSSGQWRRWSLVVLAVGLLVLLGAAFVTDAGPAAQTAVDLSLSTVFALLVLATAGDLLRTGREPEGVWLVATRAAGGALVFGALGAWAAYAIEGGASSPLTYVAFAAPPGAAAGTAAGLIDDRRRREYRRAQRVTRAIEASADGIAVLDADQRYLTVNDTFGEMAGRAPGDLVGEDWRAVTPLTEEHLPAGEIRAAIDAAGSWRGEVTVPGRDGDERETEVSLSALPDRSSVVVLRDVSDRAAYERRLRRLQTATRELLYAETTDDVGRVTVDIAREDLDWSLSSFWEYDEDADELAMTATTDATDAMFADLGLDGLPPLEPGSIGMEAFRDGEVVVVEDYAGAVDATYDLPIGTMLLAPVGDHGLLVCATGDETGVDDSERAFVDILRWTAEAALDRVERERALVASEDRFRALAENSPVGIVTIDETGTVQFASAAIDDILGYDPDALVGRDLTHVMPERFRDRHRTSIERYRETGERRLDWSDIELPGLHADGHEVPLALSFGEVELDDGHLFTGIVQDVSDRAHREEQIERIQEATLELARAATPPEVAATAVGIAQDVLDRPLSVVWRYDGEEDALVPAATSDEVRDLVGEYRASGTVRTLGEGTVEWETFRSGETRVIDDYGALDERAGSDLPLGTITYAPLGEHGLLGIGSTERRKLSTTDRYLVDILRRTTATALERTERERELREQQQRLRTVVENAPVVLFTFDTDGVFTLVQGRGLDGTDIDPDALVGQSVSDVFPDDSDLQAAVDDALDGNPGSATVELADRVFETWYQPVREEEGRVTGVIGTALDVTKSRERDRQLTALHDASRELSYAGSPETVASVTVDIASEVLDKPFSTLWAYDDATDRLRLVAMADATREFLARTGAKETLDPLGEESLAMQAYRDGSLHVAEDYGTVENAAFPELSLGTVLVVPLGDYGVLELGEHDVERMSEADRQHVELLAANAQTALGRAEREAELRRRQRMVETLQEATGDLLAADDADEVAAVAVQAAERALDQPVVGIWLRDESGDRLVSAAQSEEASELFDEYPAYTADGESLSWEAYAENETRIYDDLRDAQGVANPETLIRSELVVPLGEYGVMNVGSALPGQFDETDVHVARLLAATTEAAFERADRERELRDRTEELELRTSQMEFFNSILRHDVLNGMTVIRARGEFLADSLEGREREFAETIVRWCDDVTDVVGRVRSVLDTLTGTAEVSFQPVEVVSVVREELERVEQTYTSVAFETDLPDLAWARSDDLLAEVVGNVITNAVEHNDKEDLRVTVSVETTDERVRVSVADDGRGVADDRKDRVFRRGETGHAKSTGSGFGLFFADAMVSAYGGDIRVEDADPDATGAAGTDDGPGARFVIELPRATRLTADGTPEGTEP